MTDNGIGIEEQQIGKIFDRFYQGDHLLIQERESTGIGLALTKELVELHGGRIQVQSRVGQGTCFKVELQLKTTTESISKPRSEPSSFLGRTFVML